MIKVLIVDDIQSTVNNLTKILAFEDDIKVIGTAGNGATGIEATRELQPDIVLMDVNMPDMDGIQATEILAQECPTSPVIIMSVQGEKDYLRRAMQAGAREYLVKPFGADELIAAIRRVFELERKKESYMAKAMHTASPESSRKAAVGEVFTIVAGKGGVGRSVLASNLAVALASETNSKVCLIDLSLEFGDINVLLNLSHPRSIADLADIAMNLDAESVNEVLATGPSGIKVLLAPPSPELASTIDAEMFGYILEFLRHQFDFIVIDTSTHLSDMLLNTVLASKKVITLGQMSLPALKDTRLMLKTLESIEVNKEDIIVILASIEATSELRLDQVETTLSYPVTLLIPHEPRTVNQAVNRGITFVEHHPETEVSRSVRELVRILVHKDLLDNAVVTEDDSKKDKKKGRFGFGKR